MVAIAGSRVQPGALPTLALPPSPVTLPDPRRSHSRLRWGCSVMLKSSHVAGPGVQREREVSRTEERRVLISWQLRTSGTMIGSQVSPELSTPSLSARSVGVEGDGGALAHTSATTGGPFHLLGCHWEAAQWAGKRPGVWVVDRGLHPGPGPDQCILVGKRRQPSGPRGSCPPNEK